MASRWIALLICAVAALAPTRALACGLVSLTPAEMVEGADAIFWGRLISLKEPGRFSFGEAAYLNTARFQVTTVWKGPTHTEFEVKALNGNTSCGVHFPPGEYLVFAKFAWDASLRVSRFGGTEMLTPEEAAKSDPLKYVNQHFTAIDMSKPLAFSCSSSCASAPGGAWLPALVLLAYWLRRR
jgi:uncharacterized protein (TIGR03382 family)